ncbi:MAG: radical SAM protein [Armatimonadia bacterium]
MAAYPSYLNFSREDLAARVAAARDLLSPCRLCPRECRVQRLRSQTGYCHAGALARVASYGPHFGEERPLVGCGGSGTIFFSHCNLLCVFCQNYDLSHGAEGEDVGPTTLAGIMLSLQQKGCHNINLVTPTHYQPQILEALAEAIPLGLRLPIVYNCGGYESLEALRLLDGIVDLYMPDVKFLAPEPGQRYCAAPDYGDRAREAIREMYRQVGPLVLDDQGLAHRGLLVRHLVLPERQGDTAEVMQFIASLDPEIYVNVMAQYRPCYRAAEYPPLDRRPSRAELAEALQAARQAGLRRLDQG